MRFMKFKAGLVLSVVWVLASGCVKLVGDTKAGIPATADEVVSFKPQKPIRWQLSNGLTVIFLEDKELPVTRARLMIRGGALWADKYPVGTTSAMGDVMRTGGAGALSADSLDRELEKLAAGVSSSFSGEFGSISFSCLSSDVDRVFRIFSDVALHPRFEAERLGLWKGQSLEGIRRRVEDPTSVATIAFTQIVYGKSPYGRVSRARDIAAITRTDLFNLHQQLVRPDGAILVVTGSLEQRQVADLAQRYFGAWSPRGSRLPAAPPISEEPKSGIYFINLPFAQASVKLGELGVPRFTPDYPAIDVFNEVFGSGGFGSRLMKRVRTELGLSYGVYGGISPAVVRGVNYIFLQTKADSTGAAINSSLNVLEELRSQPPLNDELAEKKQAISNSYVFNFGSTDEIAGRMARQELLEYPTNYDETYLSKINLVEPNAVTSVAATRWNPEKLVIVVVGNQAALAAIEQERKEPGSNLARFELYEVGFSEGITGIIP